MIFDPNSSNLQLVWNIYKDFESFTRETDGDLNHFIEEWKKKMAKVQSTGCQYSDLQLGLKLMEKVNLSRDSIDCVISDLGASTFSSDSFLAEVVSKIKEQSDLRGSTSNKSLEGINISKRSANGQEIFENSEAKSDVASFSIKFLEEENLSKPFMEIHSDVFQDKAIASEKGSKPESVFQKCPICDKNFMLIDNLNKHIKSHENGISGFDEDSSFGQDWMDSSELDIEDSKIEDVPYKIKSEVTSEANIESNIPKATSKTAKPKKKPKKASWLENHPQKHLPRIPCEICGKSFAKCGFAQHMQSHTAKSLDYSCTQCNKSFKDESMLKRHVSQMHTTPLVACEVCGRSFAKSSIKLHMQSHALKTIDYKCPECEKSFKDKGMLKRHVSQMHKTPLIPCEICGKSFPKTYFSQHMQSHSAKNIACSQCDRKFISDTMLKRHVSKMHTKQEDKKAIAHYARYPCELCGKPVAENCMITHLKSHSTVADLQCDQCPKKCKKLSSLKKHMQTHKQNRPAKKPIECSICHKSYSHLTFKVHMRSHRTTRDYICSYCGKDFKTRNSLSEHMNIHTKVRQFPCQMCEKVCYSSNSLKFHIRAHHTGEKPFKCDFCDKRFYTNSKKKEHVSIHTGEKPFPCNVCGKYFRLYCTRRRHIRTVHKEVKPFDMQGAQ